MSPSLECTLPQQTEEGTEVLFVFFSSFSIGFITVLETTSQVVGPSLLLGCSELAGMDGQLMPVTVEYFLRYIKCEIDHEQELQLKIVDLVTRHPTNLSIIGIVVVDVVVELRCEHNTCDQQSMNVQGRYHERFVPLDDGVDINKSNDVAFAAAASIALYPGNAVE